MDTGTDFLRPEFLNILFFQQKNLVVFPYVDIKHLRSLEIFGEGYTIVDLESTALHNLREILEFEKSNSYSQNPILFFVYNANHEIVQEIMQLEGIRCVVNSNENVSDLANGSTFIFYNKKNGNFLNYDVMDSELEFERKLCSNFDNEGVLQERIHKIKIASLRIFKELNQVGNLENLANILSEYDKNYWPSILTFTSQYYDINIRELDSIKLKPRTVIKDFSEEYEIIISTNKQLGKEFILLMHDYREKKVNSANLELEELFMPQKLYNYLRNHHWRDGIPEDFIQDWVHMKKSGYSLSEDDKDDFFTIFQKLDISYNLFIQPQTQEIKTSPSIPEKIPKRPQEYSHEITIPEEKMDILDFINSIEIILGIEISLETLKTSSKIIGEEILSYLDKIEEILNKK